MKNQINLLVQNLRNLDELMMIAMWIGLEVWSVCMLFHRKANQLDRLGTIELVEESGVEWWFAVRHHLIYMQPPSLGVTAVLGAPQAAVRQNGAKDAFPSYQLL